MFFYLAGSYAQLTLLGQPKVNLTTQVQKTIPIDSQNGRVTFRTQSSSVERSNGINTSQPVFDIKKARDQYEKILRQLEVLLIYLYKK